MPLTCSDMHDFIKPLSIPLLASLLLVSCVPTSADRIKSSDEPVKILNTEKSPETDKLVIVSPVSNIPDEGVLLQVAENTRTVTRFIAEDVPGSELTYQLIDGNDKELFNLDEKTGDLTFKSLPDWEAPSDSDQDNNYRLFWLVSSSTGNSKGQFVIIQVTDLPE